jgi:protease-4
VILRGNNLSKLLDRVGVKFETVKSGAFKDILSPDRALGVEERELLQALIDSSYEQFVAAVAEGRKLDPSRVREFADGRVFSGAQAKDLGLVDELGDEERARVLAAQLADLDEERCRVVTLGKPRKPLLQGLSGSNLLVRLQELVTVEMELSGQPLWLFRP